MIVLIHWQGQIALEIKWINYLSKTHKKIPDFLGRNLGRNIVRLHWGMLIALLWDKYIKKN
jgi:hypothetical protein